MLRWFRVDDPAAGMVTDHELRQATTFSLAPLPWPLPLPPPSCTSTRRLDHRLRVALANKVCGTHEAQYKRIAGVDAEALAHKMHRAGLLKRFKVGQ